MDAIKNPFAPGAGTPPPELAGRDELLETIRVAIERIRQGKPSKSVLMVGLRGVGKTVLLDRMRDQATEAHAETMRVEAPESRSLPALLAPQLRLILLKLSRIEKAKKLAERALRVFSGFVNAFKMKFNDIEVGLDFEAEQGIADNGDLEHDLPELFQVVGEAAQAVSKVVAMFIDELQYVEEGQLAALITALHRTAQRKLPMVLVGAGLPQLRGQMGKAKSYAERLFDFPEVGPLTPEASKIAIRKPLAQEGVDIEDVALHEIMRITRNYPYFLQEWGKHAWEVANKSPITIADVDIASKTAIASLDVSFFRVRFDRLTPSEKKYLRAMAELGAGPHRSGDIAEMLKKKVQSLGPTRSSLIAKGMVWSPNHGDTAFTVPLFDEFMKRIMPGQDWMS